VPVFLQGLWLRVFDTCGVLLPDVDVTAIAFLRQIFCLGKKMVAVCTPERVAQSVETYYDIESELRSPTLGWQGSEFDYSEREGWNLSFAEASSPDHSGCDQSVSQEIDQPQPSPHNLEISRSLNSLQELCDELSNIFPVFHSVAYSDYRYEFHGDMGFKHGPGAVSDYRKAFDKFAFPSWSDKLDKAFPYEWVDPTFSGGRPSNVEHPSRLIAVPKTAKTPRLIASEPTCNMYAQQLIWKFLEEYISYSPLSRIIDFRGQEESQRLVQSSSRTRNLATVDLSSASDRLTCYVVERMFRKHPSLLHALWASRTTHVLVDIGSRQGDLLPKKKFASQGSAVTFPVQTLFFALCVLAVMPGRGLENKIKRYGRCIQIFGDDMIVPVERYAALKDLLTTLDLKVNDDKSFYRGAFRESCGADCYDGYDVTPVKPMSLSADGPELRASLIDFSNNLHNKGYWNAAKAATSTLRRVVSQLPIVGRSSGIAGLSSFCGTDTSHLRRRWNDGLQRYEVRMRTFRVRVRRKHTSGYLAIWRFFSESPRARKAFMPYENGYVQDSRTRDGLGWVDAASVD
jgi:hypothetical protein